VIGSVFVDLTVLCIAKKLGQFDSLDNTSSCAQKYTHRGVKLTFGLMSQFDSLIWVFLETRARLI